MTMYSRFNYGTADNVAFLGFRLHCRRNEDGSLKWRFSDLFSVLSIADWRVGYHVAAIRDEVLGSSEARLHLAG